MSIHEDDFPTQALGPAGLQHGFHGIDDRIAGIAFDHDKDFRDGPPPGFIAFPPGHQFGRDVQVVDPPVHVDRDDGVADRVQRDLRARLDCVQLLLDPHALDYIAQGLRHQVIVKVALRQPALRAALDRLPGLMLLRERAQRHDRRMARRRVDPAETFQAATVRQVHVQQDRIDPALRNAVQAACQGRGVFHDEGAVGCLAQRAAQASDVAGIGGNDQDAVCHTA